MKIIELKKDTEVAKSEITEIPWAEDFDLTVEETDSGTWVAYHKGFMFIGDDGLPMSGISNGNTIDEALINLCEELSGKKFQYYESFVGKNYTKVYPIVQHTKLLGR